MSLRSYSSGLKDNTALKIRYDAVRAYSDHLAEPLSPEDRQIQSMPDASPTKWHLAHTAWFFETFILANYMKGYKHFDADFSYLYNSYYNGIGAQFPRVKRGFVTRPSSAQIQDYRAYIDEHMTQLIADDTHSQAQTIGFLTELGTHHEQQHQELILSDIKHAFSYNSIEPAYCNTQPLLVEKAPPLRWVGFEEGLYIIGHDGDGFSYDNEKPQHKRWLNSFELASRPVTNGEFIEFIEDGGYEKPELWLSEGWAFVQKKQRAHPLYWRKDSSGWTHFTLSGRQGINKAETLTHINYYEASAYAAWAQARLPSEAEWESAAQSLPKGQDVPPPGRYQPSIAADNSGGLSQMIGDVWEWTSSSYDAYPGFTPLDGAAGEYNGKFMCNQYVLRGGSCITAPEHVRISYRNFFPTHSDWQFSGVRLARNVS
jgi:ergothioneine biosynthesis protein EgtB